uniref:50S ribosomal protein L35 n=1 Tax=Dictyotopsis propagulifera TaxID=670095 RepID=UPI002E77068A|nr:50S ribosomal protein L35 [Dictyotopsis propagulifera]WAM63195.1 50S ribosomal protein L35 [Dictyotopsis propagulifera]
MVKIKTNKAVKKRYKLISQKRFIRGRAFKSHLLQKKSSKRKRRLSSSIVVSKRDTKAIRILLSC